MNIYLLIIFFVVGSVFGSFYNVVAYRMSNNLSIIKPRSHCEWCNEKLKWYELIPILSYLFQGGKCNHCKHKLSIGYIIVELVSGILFTICYYKFGLTPKLIISLIFVSALVITIVSDIEYMIIIDEVTLLASIMILLVLLFTSGFQKAFYMLESGFFSFLTMYALKIIGDAIFKKETLGGGDIKLMFLFGITLGYDMAIVSIFLGAFLAFPISLYILLKRKDNMIPFGPFLSIGALLILITKLDLAKILNWLQDTIVK